MLANVSPWSYYSPGFVHPDFVPYLRERTTDRWGNQVEINSWKQQGPSSTVQPELVRINKGMTFQRMFESDPCPPGWQKTPDSSGYCTQMPLRHEPVFYTDKAFIAKNQYWEGPGDPSCAKGELSRTAGIREISEQSDMRSMNPLTGQYKVYFQPLESSGKVRYASPDIPDNRKYDANWNLPRQRQYASMATTDSYLG